MSSAAPRTGTSPGLTTGVRRLAVVLVLGGLLVVLDMVATIIALPAMVAEFGSSLPVLQWVTTGYTVAIVAVLPTSAALIGRFGAKPVYLAGLIIFTVASGLCVLAWNVESLIAFRVLQGLGGGLLNPVGQTIALGAVPPERRGRVMSYLGLPVLIGPLAGPFLAGWLVDAASWRLIFAINLPIGLIAAICAARLLPRQPAPERRRPDLPGLLLLVPGVLLLVLAATMIGDSRGAVSWPVLLALLVAAALLVGFAHRSLRVERPLLQLRLLRSPGFAPGTAVLFGFGAAYFGTGTVLPIYVQAVRGDSALQAGTLGIATALGAGLTMQVATRLIDRVSARRVVLFGIVTGLVGMAGLAAAVAANASYPVIMIANLLLGVGSGAAIMPAMTDTLRRLSPAETPHGAAIMGTLQQIASALGIATSATILTIMINAGAPELAGDGIAALLVLDRESRTALLSALGPATGATYLIMIVPIAAALVTALIAIRDR
ncbi:DHA2 family efflux MFS transporter permease subunit [Microlunatus speluncae]|uniref:DHA2 family efflux MFS transporter permease subunit n=1 Tax=Microlunatus speluncae TaxID=2594267 RepID=UPI00137631E3|nr:DHA2 family efflux MFS transporter permease subunit [Microlunatus speluncae]